MSVFLKKPRSPPLGRRRDRWSWPWPSVGEIRTPLLRSAIMASSPGPRSSTRICRACTSSSPGLPAIRRRHTAPAALRLRPREGPTSRAHQRRFCSTVSRRAARFIPRAICGSSLSSFVLLRHAPPAPCRRSHLVQQHADTAAAPAASDRASSGSDCAASALTIRSDVHLASRSRLATTGSAGRAGAAGAAAGAGAGAGAGAVWAVQHGDGQAGERGDGHDFA